MTFEIWQLFLAGVSYLGLLFLVAFAVEKRWIPEKLVRHPLTYTLSLGVYATSWSYYGSVGFAQTQGFNFITIYLGVTLAFALTPVLLQPILRLTREYQLSSLADLFAFRYHSQLAGVLVTLFMITGSLPYIALQIRAVTGSLTAMSQENTPGTIALGFCVTIALFAILFGARHISPREKHEGLVSAIAFESLIKLLALIMVGLFAVFGVFDGFDGLSKWLAENPEALNKLQQPVREGPWTTLLLLSFAAAFLLPRQFHMIFVENNNEQSLKFASWAFPLFLLLLNIAIPPILWAGMALDLNMPADLYVLGITLNGESPVMPMITFIGGISAASAMIIVTTLALAAMCMNHLVLPASFPPALTPETNIYRWLLWGRRILIIFIISAGYAFYLLLETNQSLVQIGLISFIAVAQFLPGIVGLLYWRRATRSGFIAGLLGGGTIWAMTQLLPLLENAGILSSELSLTSTTLDPLTFSTLLSLGINSILFVLVSLKTIHSKEEHEAAEACCRYNIQPPEGIPYATSIQQFEEQLAKITGVEMANHEVNRALADLGLTHTQLKPADLTRVRTRISRNLSGLVGPMLARMIVEERLQMDSSARTAIADTVRFVEQQLAESRTQLRGVAGELDRLRRYHRQVLEDLPMGVCTVGPDGTIINWNRVMTQMTTLSKIQAVGQEISQLPEPWSGLLHGFLKSEESQLRKLHLKHQGEQRVFNLQRAAIDDPGSKTEGEDHGTVVLMEDLTELHLLEDELAHSERLASIGRLAAGVAHEIGNPVTGISCLAQEILQENDLDDFYRENIKQILTQTERITNIVSSLVSFSHSGNSIDSTPVSLPINHIVEEAQRLISLSRGGKAIKFINRTLDEHFVLGEQQRLIQVFVNLFSNACDASSPGDEVIIESYEEDNMIRIAVSDEGVGINRNDRSRIFDPFFTTKVAGKGTGLGLPMVYNIIQEHSGTITFESEPDAGTTFIIRLQKTHPPTND